MKDKLYRKAVVLGIIFLFFGVAIAPGITATINLSDVSSTEISENEHLNNDLVEITVQISKDDGAYDYSVMLSQEQAEELERHISRTKTKLDAATTVEETSGIFNDIVMSLYELGVLPDGMSIEEAQRLVNGLEQNPRIFQKLERWYSRYLVNLDDNENFLCLIAGYTDNTFFLPPLLSIIELIGPSPFVIILLPICFILIPTWLLNPLPFGYTITFGRFSSGLIPYIIPASGWVHTIGFNGIKNWSGSFFGKLPSSINSFAGVLGFTGIRIGFGFLFTPYFYMGTALRVKIG